MSDASQNGEKPFVSSTGPVSATEREVREFLRDNFIVDADLMELPGTASLTDHAILDSMGVLELLMFLEERYRIKISDVETVPENLDTIDNAVRFVNSKLSTVNGKDVEVT